MAIQKKAINRRQQIIKATCDALAFKGHASVSMRSIASTLGLSLSTLQYYFPTKRELLASAIQEAIGDYIERIEQEIGQSKLSPLALLEFAALKQFDSIRDPFISNFFFALWGLSSHDKDVKALLDDLYNADLSRFCRLIHKANPSLSKGTAYARAVILLAQIEGSFLLLPEGRCAQAAVDAAEQEIQPLLVHLTR